MGTLTQKVEKISNQSLKECSEQSIKNIDIKEPGSSIRSPSQQIKATSPMGESDTEPRANLTSEQQTSLLIKATAVLISSVSQKKFEFTT